MVLVQRSVPKYKVSKIWFWVWFFKHKIWFRKSVPVWIHFLITKTSSQSTYQCEASIYIFLGRSQVLVFKNKKFKEPLTSTSFIVQNSLGLRNPKRSDYEVRARVRVCD
jgi:hypothetical protein